MRRILLCSLFVFGAVLTGCAASVATVPLKVTNSTDVALEVSIEVAVEDGLALCTGSDCETIDSPEIEPLVQILEPGDSVEYDAVLREGNGRYGSKQIDDFEIKVLAPDSPGQQSVRIKQSDVATASAESSLDYNEVTSVDLDFTVATNEFGTPAGSCSSTHDDGETRDCTEAMR